MLIRRTKCKGLTLLIFAINDCLSVHYPLYYIATRHIHKVTRLPLSVSREREQPPRFAQPGSFEYEYAMRWKALMEMEKQQFEQVDRNIKEAQEKLETEMEAAQHEHQVMLMRQGEHTHAVIFLGRVNHNFLSAKLEILP